MNVIQKLNQQIKEVDDIIFEDMYLKVDKKTLEEVFVFACDKNIIEWVEKLIKFIDLKEIEKRYDIIMTPVKAGWIKILKLLVENGANIHADNDFSLRWSSRNGHLEVVKYLVENGADIHAGNDRPLQWASENGHLEVVKYLVENGADSSKVKERYCNKEVCEYLKSL